MLNIYRAVAAAETFNFCGARIPVPTNLNIPAWRKHTQGYHDAAVVDLLEFGFPIGYEGPIPHATKKNHSSAVQHPTHVQAFLDKEVSKGAIIGPFKEPPFTPWMQTSPLLTRPKRDSDDRRCIMDLSFPHAPLSSVNSGTPTDFYLGIPAKLRLPSPASMAELIKQQGRHCYIYSLDLARGFRQIPVCPSSFPLLGIWTERGYYVDTALCFGLRWASFCCQRVTSVLTHVMAGRGATMINYIDDFGGAAASLTTAQHHYEQLQQLAADLGLELADHKASPPAQRMIFLGIEFDTANMTMAIPPAKLHHIEQLISSWILKATCTTHELKSLLGKLLHVANCCHPARLFLNRLLTTLRANHEEQCIVLTDEFQRDIAWFDKYLPTTNGVFILHEDHRAPVSIHVDSCTTGCGGIMSGAPSQPAAAYHVEFPQDILDFDLAICHLEALNCLVALRLWAPELKSKLVHLYSDSATAVAVLQLGRGRSAMLQTVAREIWLITAQLDITLKVSHVPGAQLTYSADALSRLHLGVPYSQRVKRLLSSASISLTPVPSTLFQLSTNI